MKVASPPVRVSTPRLGLALGGGGARGFAHILVAEALDELGVRPHVVAGTSIGAIYGAAMAAGLSGKEMRAHTEEILSARVDLARNLFAARAEPVSRILNLLPIRTSLFNAETLMDALLPRRIPSSFEELAIPLSVVATDFFDQEPFIVGTGPIRRAVAASMALPALFTPVRIDGHVLLDGGLVNPLPFDVVAPAADVTIAIDVSGAPTARADRAAPSAIEVLASSSQIFQRAIVREKLKSTRPDIYIDCPVDAFTVLDFHRFKDVLAVAAPVKDMLKRQLDLVLTSVPAEALPAPEPVPISEPVAPRKGRGRKSLEKARTLLPKRKRKN